MDDDRWWRCWTQCDDKGLLPIVGLKDNNAFRLNFIMRLRPAWTPLSSYRVTYFPVPFSFAEQEISLWLFTIHKNCPENPAGKVNGTRRFEVVPNRNLCSISLKPSFINGKSWKWFVQMVNVFPGRNLPESWILFTIYANHEPTGLSMWGKQRIFLVILFTFLTIISTDDVRMDHLHTSSSSSVHPLHRFGTFPI